MWNLPALRELVEHDVFVQERLQQNALHKHEVPGEEWMVGMIRKMVLGILGRVNMEVVEYCCG